MEYECSTCTGSDIQNSIQKGVNTIRENIQEAYNPIDWEQFRNKTVLVTGAVGAAFIAFTKGKNYYYNIASLENLISIRDLAELIAGLETTGWDSGSISINDGILSAEDVRIS